MDLVLSIASVRIRCILLPTDKLLILPPPPISTLVVERGLGQLVQLPLAQRGERSLQAEFVRGQCLERPPLSLTLLTPSPPRAALPAPFLHGITPVASAGDPVDPSAGWPTEVEARVAVTTAARVGAAPAGTAPAGVSTVASVQWGSASSLPGGGASGPCSRVSFFPGATCNGAVMQHIYSYSRSVHVPGSARQCRGSGWTMRVGQGWARVGDGKVLFFPQAATPRPSHHPKHSRQLSAESASKSASEVWQRESNVNVLVPCAASSTVCKYTTCPANSACWETSDIDSRAATCRCKDGYAVINGTCQGTVLCLPGCTAVVAKVQKDCAC
ncbi:unnamed protein product [Closterium sp. Naga37s-1]|nr:unnamed protein product [Closterium sp. Naga37s-1]